MEIENLVEETIVGFTGQKSALPMDMLKNSDAEAIDGFITRKGRLRKIWGARLYFNHLFSGLGRVSWIDRLQKRWAYQQGVSIALENTEDQADFIESGTIRLGNLSKVFSDTWQNNLYLTNGCENKFIEYAPQFRGKPYTKLMNLGIIPPGNGAKNWDGTGSFQPNIVLTQINALGTPQVPYAGCQWATSGVLANNTFAAGGAGTGFLDTLTANAAGLLVVDNNLPALGDRIVVKNEVTTTHNGVYTVTTLGTSGVAWVLTRAPDFDTSDKMTSGAIFTIAVADEAVNSGITIQVTFAGSFVVNTNSFTFTTVVLNPSPAGTGKQFGYVATWWDANRKVESLPWGAQVGDDGFWNSYAASFGNSIAAAMTFQGYNFRVNIKQLKDFGYDKDRVTHFIVYRWTQADTTTFKRIADPDDINAEPSLRIANDFIDDVTPEADLGKVLDESLSPPPSGLYYGGTGNPDTDQGIYGPRFVKYFRSQLWLFGSNYPGSANGTEIQSDGISAKNVPYAPQSGWAYASQAGNFDYWKYSYDISRSVEQADTGMAIHRGTMIFFKEGSAHYLSGTDPTNYVIVPLDIKRGIVAPGSIQETTKGVIGLASDCFALFDSISGAKSISDEIDDEVNSINLQNVDQITSTFDPKEEKYECHVPIENTYNTKVFVYDLKTGVWSFHQRAGAAIAYGLSSNRRVVGLLGNTQNNRVYRIEDESLTQIDGQNILSSWRSKQLDFGHPSQLKILQRVLITARSIKDFKISIDVIPDMADSDCATIEDHDPDVHNDDWASGAGDSDGAVFDQSLWDAQATRKKFSILVQCIGRNLQLIVRNSDSDAGSAGFEIEEIILQASLVGGSNDD